MFNALRCFQRAFYTFHCEITDNSNLIRLAETVDCSSKYILINISINGLSYSIGRFGMIYLILYKVPSSD